MKKFYTSLMVLATVAMAFSSCSKEVDVQEDVQVSGKMKTITVKTDIETRTTLDADHANLVWSSGDQISIFNDADNTNSALTYAAGGDLTVQVPEETEEIYAHYPYYDGNTSGPESVSIYINNKQTQVDPGKLEGKYFPMVAKGTVSSDNKALISLYPVASALALNIYHTGLSGEETVKSVKVTPSTANTKFTGSQVTNLTGNNIKYTEAAYSNPITVTLTNPFSLGNTKPADKQKFANQIYVCLAKQSYANVKFEIETSKGTYTITSSDTPFDCINSDFVPVNINLNKASFEEAEPDYATLPWEWTGSSTAGKDDLLSNYGVSGYGLGEYAAGNAPYRVKFDGVGDYILIKTDKAIGSVTFMTKTLGGAEGATFKVQASANSSVFSDIESFSTATTANTVETFTTTSPFDASYRFVRIYMSVRGSNVGVGHIKVTSGVAEPTIGSITTFNAAATGGEGLTSTVELSNYSQAPTLNAVVDGNVVTAATVSNVTTTEATITYTLAPNYSGAGRSGLITLTDENNVSGKITIYQDPDRFTVSSTEIELAATAGATKTLTVVSDYDWIVDDALIEGFTVTPMSGEGSSSAVTLTVKSTAANSTASAVELGAFAIKRTVDGKESSTITVSQKSAKLAAPTLNISGDASAKTITVSWGKNNNAAKYTYYVLDSELEYKVAETTTTDNTTTSFTINDITLGETYSIAVKAIGNNDPWIDSDETVEEYVVSGGVTTYQHIFTTKPGTGNSVTLSGQNWNIAATNLNAYQKAYAGVQIGSSKNDGQITLTSSNWSYEGKTTITEVRLWLNVGGTSVTPTVTINGQSATSDGTEVVKNSSADGDYTKATCVTFTPAANGNSGVVVIDVLSVKAGYICAIEIDCQ